LASRPAIALLAATALLLAGGCGSDDPGAADATHGEGEPATATGGAVLPPTTATPAPAPAQTTSTETTPPAATTPPPTTTTGPEEQQGGAGDEEAAVVPAAFTLVGRSVRPEGIEVPAFFTIRLIGAAADGEHHTMVFRGRTLEVPAGKTASADFKGLKAGTYAVTVDGRKGAATVTVSKDAAGP
jgi:hypothetical protein